MVKREPNIIRGRISELFWLIVILCGLYNALFLNSPQRNPIVTFLNYGGTGIILFGWGVAQERFWRRQDQRRQQAASGDQSLIADFQPTSDAAALSLPVTITQRTAKDWVIYLIIVAILLLALFAFLIYQLLLQSTFADKLLVLFLFLFIAGAFTNYAVVPIVRGYQQLTVDESGVSVRVGFGRTHHIRWEEAQLFAASSLYKPNTGMRQLPSYYELSNANEIVRWRWVRTRGFVAIEPTLPIGEYDRQIRALLSLIVAKTKLTLYDVRPANEK